MVTSSVKMVLDSISPEGIRLCTMHLRYWRPIHSELMTHRVFSRNARSSRAVPVATLLSEDMFIPVFGMNQPGMQSVKEAPPELQQKWADDWEALAWQVRAQVHAWSGEGMHKQWANRPLEWFGWIDVLVTSTDWENFFALRLDGAAQPELRILAEQMDLCMRSSQPQQLWAGDWHLPYILAEEYHESNELGVEGLEILKKLSTARCARLSYKPFDGEASIDAEKARYTKLVENRPVHASPAEHQATPDTLGPDGSGGIQWRSSHRHGNFTGWIQHRKDIPHEQVPDIGTARMR